MICYEDCFFVTVHSILNQYKQWQLYSGTYIRSYMHIHLATNYVIREFSVLAT